MPSVIVNADGSVPTVTIRRDDQTIMWQLAQGARWGTSAAVPVRFLSGGTVAGVTYADWPGTEPRSIETGAPAERKPYWASADHPMPDSQSERYHYELDVETLHEDGTWKSLQVRVAAEDGTWHDPDVVNDPQP